MPRKKTVQPEPMWTETYDNIIVEVRGPGTYEIGRGLHKRDAFEELCVRILEYVIGDYVTKEGVISNLDSGVMKSAKTLDDHLEKSNIFGEITDPEHIRKRIYPRVKSDIQAFIDAKLATVSRQK